MRRRLEQPAHTNPGKTGDTRPKGPDKEAHS